MPLSVVVRWYNEEAVIALTHARLVSALERIDDGVFEIINVNDGSRASTRG